MATTNPIKVPDQLKGMNFNPDNLKKSGLLEEKVELYVNAFPIKFNKDIQIHHYKFTIVPETKEEFVISKIFAELSKDIHKDYGNFYYSGDHIYSIKEVLEAKDYKGTIVNKGKVEYIISIDKKDDTSIIKKGQTSNFNQIHEKIIFLIIREILTTNPNVKVDRDNFYLENVTKEVKGYGQTYFIHDGYKLSLKQTENGLCLIIGIKNRVKGDLSVYDALMDENANYGDDLDERIENLIGKRFVPEGSSKSKIIYDIEKDRNPKNTSRSYGKETYTDYVEFFKKVFNKTIKDVKQPMISVKVKGPEGEDQFIYYVPEFCTLNGINENDIENYKFMNNLSKYTK